MTREELLVALAARVLALGDDRPRLVALEGMAGVGKTTLATDVVDVVTAAGRPVVRVASDDFHHPAAMRRRRGRLSAIGYLEDAFDEASLRALVIDPVLRGAASLRTACFDLAGDQPVTAAPVALARDAVVLVEGTFLLTPGLGPRDLAVLLVAAPAVALERGVRRDVALGLGSPASLRERYLRRDLAAWALHEERDDPWSLADVVVDLTDPEAPRVLG